MSKYKWSYEQTYEANKNLAPNMVMYDGMSGKPFAICFPFHFAGYFIATPEEWGWLKNKFKNRGTNEGEEYEEQKPQDSEVQEDR